MGARLGNLLTSGYHLAVGVSVQAVAAAIALSAVRGHEKVPAVVLSAPAQAYTADIEPYQRKNGAKPVLDGFEKSNYARDIDAKQPTQPMRRGGPEHWL